MQTYLKGLLVAFFALLLVGCASAQAPADTAAAEEPVPIEEAEGVDVRITVDEVLLTQLLAEQLSGDALAEATAGLNADVMLEDPEADLAPTNQVRVTATINADAYGIEAALRPTITMLIVVEEGQIAVEVGGVSLGDVGIPLDSVEEQLTAAEQTIQTQLEGALQQVADQAGLTVQEVLVTDDTLYLDLGR